MMSGVSTSIPTTLGEYLVELRRSRGLSQRALAAMTQDADGAGVTVSHIAHIEARGLGAKPEKIEKLANALMLSAEEHARLNELAGHGAGADYANPIERLQRLEHRVEHIERLERRVEHIEETLDVIEDRLRRRPPHRGGRES